MERSFTEIQLIGGILLVALLAILGGQARFVRLRRLLGLEQLLASSFVFLPLGMLLSEAGLGVVNRAVVREFDALVTLGLGVLGLLLGLRVKSDGEGLRGSDPAILRASAVEMLFTLVLVGVPLFFLLEIVGGLSTNARAAAAALLGCTAAISSGESLHAASRGGVDGPRSAVVRVADAGTVAGLLAAGLLLALLSPGTSLGKLESLLALAAIGTVGGLASWLLASETKDEALRTALLMGVLLVTAGTAAHLSLPPVAATLLSGITIAHLPGPLAGKLRRGLRFLETPLTVLLLVIAGASLQMPTLVSLVVLALYLVLRTAGKILGGRLASGVSPLLPRRMGLGLLPSHAVALGLALDFHAIASPAVAEAVMTVAVLGSLLSETAGIWTTRLVARAVPTIELSPETTPPPLRDAPAPHGSTP